MDPAGTTESIFALGTWVGRKQALGLIAGRCTAAEIECLIEVYENKLYLAVDPTWEDYCRNRLGIGRRTAERLIRNYRQHGPNLVKLNCFTRIKPTEYRLFAAALSDEGLLFHGETIPLDPQNAPRLAQAVEALRQESLDGKEQPAGPAAKSFARAEKCLATALAEFSRIRAMQLDEEGRLRLMTVVEDGRSHLDRLLSTLVV